VRARCMPSFPPPTVGAHERRFFVSEPDGNQTAGLVNNKPTTASPHYLVQWLSGWRFNFYVAVESEPLRSKTEARPFNEKANKL
jgi:hypothetical protein